MKIKDYQGLAMRTSTGTHDRVLNGCLGLIGESGEIVDAVKKWEFQSGENPPFPAEKILDECGDVLWYCAELATGLGSDLAGLYDAFQESFYRDLHPLNQYAKGCHTVCVRLSYACGKPYQSLYEMPDGDREDEGWREALAKGQIVGIMVTIRDILELYCMATLEEAMEHNIAKLMKRYPDGFDPERSLHRAE